jgi:hypothetical protein
MTPMLGSKLRRGSRCNPISMHLRTLASLLVALLTLGLIAGCGGGDSADSSTDVQELLDATFSGDKAIESGKLNLGVTLESDSGQPATVKVSGPFQSQGAGRLPQLDIDASLEGGGQSLSGGLTATEDRAFVTWDGTSYEIAGPVFKQFKAGYEQAAKQSEDQQSGQSLASLGIDPRRWLTNAKNEGERDVGGTETILITGDVDVPKLLEDVDNALEKVRSLGVQGSEQLPERLTDEEKRQTAEAIDKLSVEIYTGAEDRILRRMVIALGLKAPEGTTTGGAQSLDARLDLQLLEVNEDQEIEAPENAESFDKLLQQLEGLGLSLGDLGGLGGGGGGAGSGGGGGTTQQNLEKYSQCIQEAGGDNAKVRKCADLLTTP